MALTVYKKIAANISRKIDSGDLAPGSQIMSASQLCSKYDISHVTALKVFKELASYGYVTASRGRGYFVNNNGRGSGAVNNACVAVMMRPFRQHSDDNNYFNEINLGIAEECNRLRFNHLNLHCTAALSNKNPEESALAEIKKSMLDLANQVDGYIVDARIPDAIINEVRKKTKKPLVIVQRESELKIDCIMPEENPAADQMFNMLQRLNYKYFIVGKSGGNELDPVNRGNRFTKMLLDAGIKKENIADFSNYYIQPREKTVADVFKIYKQNTGKLKTVIICGSDAIAKDLLEDLPRIHGLKIPEDIGLTGFGNYAYAKHRRPHLTGIEVFPNAIGELAVETLLSRIENGNYLPYKVHYPQSTFVIGETI
jgi:DNA-binding LacI/PurR family transcriptional regulator